MSVFLKLKPEISKQRLIITKLLELEILNICDNVQGDERFSFEILYHV